MGLGRLQTAHVDWRGAVARVAETERDQPALWLPVMLGAGVAGWFLLPDAHWWGALMLAAGAAALAGWAADPHGRGGRALLIGGLAVALGCGLVWQRAERLAAPVLERPAVAVVTGVIEDVERQPAEARVRLTVAVDAGLALPPRVRINVPLEDAARVTEGARVSMRARLMPPAPAAVPGAYDFARVAWFQRLGATGKALDPPVVTGSSEAGDGLRDRLSAHIQSRLEGSAGGIASALATGDRGAISAEDDEAMRRSGLAHLLSVSGLHVTAVVGATFLLVLKLLALSPWLALRAPLRLIAAGAAALAAVGYTLLAGAEVPTIRSCVAALLVLLALALGREAFTMRLIAAGAVIVLLLWPESLAGPSFQLSFAAVAAIVALHESRWAKALLERREEDWGRRAGRFALGLLLTGIVVEIALMPIALYHFHRAGLYGAAANIVAIPLTTFVIMPLEAVALLLDAAGLGAPLWWLTGLALELLLWIAHVVASAPGAVAAIPHVPDGAFALTLVGGLWVVLWHSRMRLLGLPVIAAGLAWIALTPAPDLLVTGDGRHAALRTDAGLVLLRERAGDYVRDMLAENGGVDGALAAIDGDTAARCSRDLCVADLKRGDRIWRVLATRSGYFVDMREMAPLCASADIAISDRRLPRSCVPRWLKLDRETLERTGGVALTLATGEVRTAKWPEAAHPWRKAETVMPARPAAIRPPAR